MTVQTTNLTKPAAPKARISARLTKARIVEAACDLIAEGGYDALTSSAVTKRAGISKGGLYYHFDCMHDLAFAAFDETAVRIFGGLASGRPKSFHEYLDEVEYVLFELLLKDQKKLRIISEFYPRIAFDAEFAEYRNTTLATNVKRIRDLISDGPKMNKKQVEMAVLCVSQFLAGCLVQNREIISVKKSREIWRWFREALNEKLMRG